MIHRYDIVVNGGGMTGLALACALGQQGKKVAVLEAGPEPAEFAPGSEPDLRVVALNRASQALLDNLGAWNRLRGWRISPYQRMHVWDAGNSGNISFSAADLGEPNLGHIVENNLIQRALFEVAQSLESVDWIDNIRIKNIAIDTRDAIITLEDGRILTSQLIIGADGRFSQVREAAGIALHSRDYHHQGIVAIIGTEHPGDLTAWQRFLPDGVLAFLPLSDGRSSIVWSTQRAEEILALDDEAFKQALGEAFDFHLGKILTASKRAAFPLIGRHADTYIKPRIALIGDAAHTIHPLAGQGVNLGFMDVAELANVLSTTQRDYGSLSVLRRYERARKGENTAMQKLMEGFQTLFINNIPPLAGLRGLGLTIADNLLPIKSEMMRYAMGTRGDLPPLSRYRLG
jgi:2-octaprenylphenol hydroxylase